MMDILFLICVIGGGGMGIFMAIKPDTMAADHRAKGGSGMYADPAKVRVLGIVMAITAATVFILRTFVIS